MTRKDYKAIAGALWSVSAAREHPTAKEMLMLADVVESIADVLATDNPRFDRTRFVEAAYLGRGL